MAQVLHVQIWFKFLYRKLSTFSIDKRTWITITLTGYFFACIVMLRRSSCRSDQTLRLSRMQRIYLHHFSQNWYFSQHYIKSEKMRKLWLTSNVVGLIAAYSSLCNSNIKLSMSKNKIWLSASKTKNFIRIKLEKEKLDSIEWVGLKTLPFGLVRKPWIVNGLPRFFNRKILSWLLCAWSCCNWLMPLCVACRMAFKLRWRRPRKKWTAGLANPISDVDPCGDASAAFSSQADSTSSASIPIFIVNNLNHWKNVADWFQMKSFQMKSFQMKPFQVDQSEWISIYHATHGPSVRFPFAKRRQCRQNSQRLESHPKDAI